MDPQAYIAGAVAERRMIGVSHADRIDFLQDNGYEVTLENMIDVQLSARQAPTEDTEE